MNQTSVATAIGTGKINLPLHLRGKSLLQHGAPCEVLEHHPNGDAQKVKIRCGGREYDVENRFVSENIRT